MVDAAGHVIIFTGERFDRTGAEAGLAVAGLAWMRTWRGCGQVEGDREEECRPEGMPEAIGRMDVHAERRDMAGLGPPRPGQEGQRRLVEGIDGAGVEIAGICEPDAALRAQRVQAWGISQAYGDVGEFLAAVRPDAVVIATPNRYHKPLIFQALDAGCHVLSEKPLGMDYPETVEIYEKAQASGKVHMTAFTYRFVPGMNYLRHLVRSGELGEIRHARFQRLQDWGEFAIGWRQYKAMAGSGELGDMGIHRIDFAQDLLGPITAVMFVAGKFALGLYLAWSDVTSTYGAAGSLALILLWVYYSALILFLGAEFTQVRARRRGRFIAPEPGAKPTD